MKNNNEYDFKIKSTHKDYAGNSKFVKPVFDAVAGCDKDFINIRCVPYETGFLVRVSILL